MVRPGRDRLSGAVEMDETYWGGEEEGVVGRLTHEKTLIIVAAQEDGRRIERIRMRRIPDVTRATLHGIISDVIEPGSVVRTDGYNSYEKLDGYRHQPVSVRGSGQEAHALLPRAHRVISLLERWLLGTHQGAIHPAHLDYYLDEFTFRFNRRRSASRGKLFYRLLQQAVQIPPAPYETLIKHVSPGPEHKR
jgi:transposase-like protein